MTAATLPPQTERQFMEAVCQYAELRQWEWVHFRAARTLDSWRTPVSGTLGKGWVDLLLIHKHRRRLLMVELKRDGAKLTLEQERVHSVLRRLAWDDAGGIAGSPQIELKVWRPSDWPDIERTLA